MESLKSEPDDLTAAGEINPTAVPTPETKKKRKRSKPR